MEKMDEEIEKKDEKIEKKDGQMEKKDTQMEENDNEIENDDQTEKKSEENEKKEEETKVVSLQSDQSSEDSGSSNPQFLMKIVDESLPYDEESRKCIGLIVHSLLEVM